MFVRPVHYDFYLCASFEANVQPKKCVPQTYDIPAIFGAGNECVLTANETMRKVLVRLSVGSCLATGDILFTLVVSNIQFTFKIICYSLFIGDAGVKEWRARHQGFYL